MTVRKILDSKGHGVVSIDPESTLATAVKTLSERKIGAILVMGSDQRLEGILSERDIVRVLGQRGPEVLSSPVSATMTAKVVTCERSATISAVMEMMTSGKFRHLP